MTTIEITKERAEFIVNSATRVTPGESWEKTYYIPVFFKMTDVMIDCNVVTGKFNGSWIEYQPIFTEEATEILGIY